MTQKDRDRMIELFVFFNFLKEWTEDDETELRNRDMNKIKIIKDNVIALIVQYQKLEGKEAIDALLDETCKYKFAFVPKDDNTPLTDTFELGILKTAIKKVVENSVQCEMCNRHDFKYCEWYTINKFLDKPTNKCKKNCCPFKNNLNDIFNVEDI